MSSPAMSESVVDPAIDAGLDQAGLVALHRAMLLARVVDERLAEAARQGALEPWTSGQAEAALVGAASVLAAGDWLFAGPRDLAAVLRRGVALDVAMSHVFATASDPTKARALPQRLALRGLPAIAGASTHNGAHLTHAAGVAWAAKIQHDDAIALAFFDEDEMAGGEFHNALNFAGVFRLPVVFVAVRAATTKAGESAKERGIAYGVPGVSCDGADVLAVARTVRQAATRARAREGATIIEATCSADEAVAAITRFERHLATHKGHDPTTLASCDALRALVDESIARARASASVSPDAGSRPAQAESMFDDVYRTLPSHLVEEREEMRRTRTHTRTQD